LVALEPAALDARLSAGVRARLPGLEQAMDETAMRARFQAALDGLARASTIEGCARGKVHLGDEDCVVRYELRIRESPDGPPMPVLVTCRVLRHDGAYPAYLEAARGLAAQARDGRSAPGPGMPVLGFESMVAVAHPFPVDPDLPTLVAATDFVAMKGVLEQALTSLNGHHAALERGDIEAAHYPRRQRCVLRYYMDSETGRVLLYGKVASEDRASFEQEVADRLRRELDRQPGVDVRLPRYLAHVPELRLRLMEAVPGAPVIGALVKDAASGRSRRDRDSPTLEDAIDGCASVLAAVHRAGIDPGRTRDAAGELAGLRKDLDAIAPFAPELARYVDGAIEGVVRSLETSDALPPCFSHGDFTHSQVLFDDSRRALIDFDDVCHAEPALDLGQFCAYVLVAADKAAARGSAPNGFGAGLRTRFVERYVAEAGLPDAGAVMARTLLYERLSLLRMALRGWRQLKPARVLTALGVQESQDQTRNG
jgi:Phosphotransferase enzyme family